MESPFTLEILGNSHFRLRRQGEDLQRVFSSVKEALDYVQKVSDETGIVFERRWEEDRHLLGASGNHNLVAEPAYSASSGEMADYVFLE
jgi:hypothetical protein